MAKHVVALADDVPVGERKMVTVRGRQVVIFNVEGEFFAMLDRCPHQGGSLCSGAITGLPEGEKAGDFRFTRKGEIVRCPWHGWEFDIKTGRSYCRPDQLRARQFPVSVEPGAAVVEGPYVAETFPVSVVDSYLVIDA